MIDNFELLREVLSWDDIEGWFYPISIIQRSKDGHPFSQRILDHFYVDSLEKFDVLEQRIKDTCIESNARAYIIHPNPLIAIPNQILIIDEKPTKKLNLRPCRKSKYDNVRRNDICLCGSGLKYKRCCIND